MIDIDKEALDEKLLAVAKQEFDAKQWREQLDAQKARVMLKLKKARVMIDWKLSTIKHTLTDLTKWQQRARRYEKHLDLINAGRPISRPRPAHKPKRRINL